MLPKEVQGILDEQGLRLVEILQYPNTKRRRFFSLRVRSVESGFGESDLLLKIFGRGDPNVISGFEKEAEFLRLAGSLGSDGLKRHVPQFIARGGDLRPWYLRECVDGDFLGDICFDFGIQKKFLTPALMSRFLSFFENLRMFSERLSETEFFLSLSSHDYSWYRDDLNYYREYIWSVSQADLDLASNFLDAGRVFLDHEARFLVHGDLYLKNMFWSAERLVVTDWELLHRGNPAFDLGFIWALSFRDPDWQHRLLEGFKTSVPLESGVFWNLFRIAVVSVSLRFIRHSEIMLKDILSSSQREARENAREALDAYRQIFGKVCRHMTM